MFLVSPDYYQIKNTKHKGRGVFAKKDIPAGVVIGDYTGRIISDKEIDGLEKKFGNACYAMDYADNDTSIFPLDIKAVGMHVINHSCTPNCNNYYYYGHTLFFTLRKIFAGEEITIDYSFDPDPNDKEASLHPCFCGSEFCRGTQYSEPKRLKKYGDFCYKEVRGQKFKIQPVDTILEPLAKYPKVIKDAEVYDLFSNFKIKPFVYHDKSLPVLKIIRQRLRETGASLNFVNLKLIVLGVSNGYILGKGLAKR